MNENMIKLAMPHIEKLLPEELPIPDWVGPAANAAVDLAEVWGRKENKRGKQKKAKAKETLKAIGKAIDIPGIPEPIEALLENLLIDAAVELAWSMKRRR